MWSELLFNIVCSTEHMLK